MKPLPADELEFVQMAQAKGLELPQTFLLEKRAERLGISPAELSNYPAGVLNLELACEMADISLPDTHLIKPYTVSKEQLEQAVRLDECVRLKQFTYTGRRWS